MRIMSCLGGITLGLLGLAAVQAAAAQAPQSISRSGIAGAWALNREKSQIPEPGSTPVDQGGARDNGGRGRGGFGGRGGPGGPRGGDFGPPGGGGPSPEQMQATMNYVRRLMQPSERLIIIVRDASVSMTDADGITVVLDTTDKKEQSKAENGLVKLTRKSRWEGSALVSEVDIENGPKITRKYELGLESSELRVTTTMSGGIGGRGSSDANRPLLFVYQRPA